MTEKSDVRFHSGEVRFRDLRRTLVHEHAHQIIANSHGAIGRVDIWPNSSGDLDEKHFLGNFTLFTLPRDARAACMIGLAGALASMLTDDPALDADTALDELEWCNDFSATDRDLAGQYSLTDVEATIERLRQVWDVIVRDVELAIPYYQIGVI